MQNLAMQNACSSRVENSALTNHNTIFATQDVVNLVTYSLAGASIV